MIGIPDILYLQKVEIYDFLLSVACRVIWPNSAIFYSHHDASQGVVVSLLSPYLISSVVAHSSNLMHRIVSILLSFQNYSFGIVNIYARNDFVEPSQLWHWMVDSLPPITWVICGDFNMVDMTTDKEGIFPFHWIAI